MINRHHSFIFSQQIVDRPKHAAIAEHHTPYHGCRISTTHDYKMQATKTSHKIGKKTTKT